MKRWLSIAGAAVTAVLLVLAGAKVGREKRRADKAEQQAQAYHHQGSKKAIEKAAKLQAKSDVHKQNAEATRQRMETQLESLGEKDETLADIAERFNGRRVRKSTGGST
jgi:cytochrome c-type biogenesis protein CcmH/NrfG